MAGIPTPSDALGIKLASVIVHLQEGMSSEGHVFDHVAVESGLGDPEVKDYMERLEALALLPVKRSAS